jgi:hypothetical protein
LRGQRFLVGMGGGRKRLNILGAYCPQDHEYLDLRVPKGTIAATQVIELLTRLQQRHPQTKKFILYLDNARYDILTLPFGGIGAGVQLPGRVLRPRRSSGAGERRALGRLRPPHRPVMLQGTRGPAAVSVQASLYVC